MLHISKGAILRPCDIDEIIVSRCGCDYTLHNPQAKLWLNGRYKISEATFENQKQPLCLLEKIGLIESSEDIGDIAKYRMLTNCVICKAAISAPRLLLNSKERWVYKWTAGAGGKLTISELIFLVENGIDPKPFLLGADNWQALVNTIYTADTISDGILDVMMERSPAMPKTVAAVLGLLQKKRILLV